jgi:hypothetical protein
MSATSLDAELRKLYPSSGRGRPKGRPNTITIQAAMHARELRARGFVGQHLGEAVAELVDRERPYDSEELRAAERALRDALERGLRVDVPPAVATLSADRARRAQALLARSLQLVEKTLVIVDITHDLVHELSVLQTHAELMETINRPASVCKLARENVNWLRARLDERADRLALEAFERGREKRLRRIKRWGPRFEITERNTVRGHESVTLEPDHDRRWRWRYQRDQWQLAVVGETLGREAMEELAEQQRSERNAERQYRAALGYDDEYFGGSEGPLLNQ